MDYFMSTEGGLNVLIWVIAGYLARRELLNIQKGLESSNKFKIEIYQKLTDINQDIVSKLNEVKSSIEMLKQSHNNLESRLVDLENENRNFQERSFNFLKDYQSVLDFMKDNQKLISQIISKFSDKKDRE